MLTAINIGCQEHFGFALFHALGKNAPAGLLGIAPAGHSKPQISLLPLDLRIDVD
jgi:hypothetical protein